MCLQHSACAAGSIVAFAAPYRQEKYAILNEISKSRLRQGAPLPVRDAGLLLPVAVGRPQSGGPAHRRPLRTPGRPLLPGMLPLALIARRVCTARPRIFCPAAADLNRFCMTAWQFQVLSWKASLRTAPYLCQAASAKLTAASAKLTAASAKLTAASKNSKTSTLTSLPMAALRPRGPDGDRRVCGLSDDGRPAAGAAQGGAPAPGRPVGQWLCCKRRRCDVTHVTSLQPLVPLKGIDREMSEGERGIQEL